MNFIICVLGWYRWKRFGYSGRNSRANTRKFFFRYICFVACNFTNTTRYERTNVDAETTAKAQKLYEEALAAIKKRDDFYKQTQEEFEDMTDIPHETQKAISERNRAITDLYRKAASYVRRSITFVILCHACYRFHPCNRSQVGPLGGATNTVKCDLGFVWICQQPNIFMIVRFHEP